MNSDEPRFIDCPAVPLPRGWDSGTLAVRAPAKRESERESERDSERDSGS
jgi:hypothetical protein